MANTVYSVSNNPSSPVYNSSAPNITGQVGSLTTALDALLVNGFSGYAGPGWTINQTTTNKRGYKNNTGGSPAGTGFVLWVDDTAAGAGGAKEARCTGFESMSGLGTGSGQFPTGAQVNIGTTPNGALICRKSTTADATVRYYTFYADATVFYMFIETGDATNPTACYSFSFGDFYSYSSTDTSNCQIQGRPIENSNAMGGATAPSLYEPMSFLNTVGLSVGSYPLTYTMPGCYCASNFNGVGGSLPFGKHTDIAKTGVTAFGGLTTWGIIGGGACTTTSNSGAPGGSALNMPNGPDGGLYAAPVFIHHNGNVRGYMKGLWAPLQYLPLNHNDTFSGTGNLSGKSFQCMSQLGPVSNLGSGLSGTLGNGAETFVETTSSGWT